MANITLNFDDVLDAMPVSDAAGGEVVIERQDLGGFSSIQYKQREAIALAACGASAMDIARKLNWGYQQVHGFLSSRIAVAQMRAIRENRDIQASDIQQTLAEMVPNCIAYLDEVINDPAMDPKLRAKTAESVIDRAGFGAVKRSITADVSMGGTVLDMLKQRAREAGAMATSEAEPIAQTA